MPSDAKVPDPLPRGLTVPAVAVVVLVLTGAIWGIGLFLLGRQTAPVVERRRYAQANNGAQQPWRHHQRTGQPIERSSVCLDTAPGCIVCRILVCSQSKEG